MHVRERTPAIRHYALNSSLYLGKSDGGEEGAPQRLLETDGAPGQRHGHA